MPSSHVVPPSQPDRGLVYDGLRRDPGGPCQDTFAVGKGDRCTHGPDPAPEGVDITQSMPPLPAPATSPPAPRCEGDGVSGKRTQVLYVRASDRPDRSATYLESIRTWARESDLIYQRSAAKTGGIRHVRFVHDGACNITVESAVVPPGGNDSFETTITALEGLGFDRTDRKYMLFVDANVYCGIGDIWMDDQPGAANVNNTGPGYGRIDSGCWNGRTAAHEHMHNLGGVQRSASHSNGGGHCIDEKDLLCYPDRTGGPPMQLLCPGAADEELFDCNNDDYFNASPAAGSYLATRWNAADSQYLLSSSPPTISVSDASISEGGGVSGAVFTLRLSQPADSPVTVVASTSDGTAVAPADYAATSATVTFPAGATTQTFPVKVSADSVAEPNETFSVSLTGPVGATIADDRGSGTIVDEVAGPQAGGGATISDS